MPVIVKSPFPSSSPSIVALAFAGLEKQRRAERRGSKAASGEVEKLEVAHPKDAAVRSEAYLRLVAARPCKNCGRQKRSQAAHVPPVGKAIKQDDRETFPMCATGTYGKGCHDKFDQYELMPRPQAIKQGKKWAAETRAEIQVDGLWPKNLPKWKGSKK